MPQLSMNRLLTLVLDGNGLVGADVETLLRLGRQAVAARNRVLARHYFSEVVEREAEHEEALVWLAGLVRDPAQSAAYLWRVLQRNPAHAKAAAGLAWAKAALQRQREEADGPLLTTARLIAACYGPTQLLDEGEQAEVDALLRARAPRPPLPAARLREALRHEQWAVAADMLCGVGLHADDWPTLSLDVAVAERVRQGLEADRRRRAAGICYERARVALAAGLLTEADHYLARLRLTIAAEVLDVAPAWARLRELERAVAVRRRGRPTRKLPELPASQPSPLAENQSAGDSVAVGREVVAVTTRLEMG